LDVNINL